MKRSILTLVAAGSALACAAGIQRRSAADAGGGQPGSAAGSATAVGSDPDVQAGRLRLPHCRVQYINHVQLSSERLGTLDFVAAEGTAVRAQDLVAHFRDDLVRAALAIQEREAANDTEVRFAHKASEVAQFEYLKALQATRAVAGSVSDIEQRELRLAAEKSLFQLKQAEEKLAIARLKLEETKELLKTHRVAAPFAGVVTKVYRKASEVIRTGEPILEITDSSRVMVEGYLPVEWLPKVKQGDAVEVQLEPLGGTAPAASFAGRVAFINVRVEPVAKKVRLWAEVANRDNLLLDGLTATLLIPLAR